MSSSPSTNQQKPSRHITWDEQSILIDGQRILLIGGELHYARAPRDMWPRLLDQCVAAGINCIATYCFWGFHEPKQDEYDFSGDRDLGYFLKLCAERDLNVFIRTGPYVCAEWNYGGFPAYLRDVPGVMFRTWNEPYLKRVEAYYRRLCDVIRPSLATRGGPVILVQVENEYANVRKRYGAEGDRYILWMADLARSAGMDVPILMCETGGAEIPNVLASVNGHSISPERVKSFREHTPGCPLLWTEFWPGWYDTWGYQHHSRDARNMAYRLLEFIAMGGTGWNYYMWFGGTNFFRNSMYLQITDYDIDCPVDQYGELRLKGAYLGRLHHRLSSLTQILLEGTRTTSGDQTTWTHGTRSITVKFDHHQQRASIVDERGNVLYDTAADFEDARAQFDQAPWRSLDVPLTWQSWLEPMPSERRDSPTVSSDPVEQLRLTRDESDYCWYSAEIDVQVAGTQRIEIPYGGDRLTLFLDGQPITTSPAKLIENRGPTVEAAQVVDCVNQLELQIGKYDHAFQFQATAGKHRIDILASALGLIKGDWMVSGPMHTERKGIWSKVLLNGNAVTGWQMRPMLAGETLGLVDEKDAANWQPLRTDRPLAWHKAEFGLPKGFDKDHHVFRIDATGLGKGMLFLNGHALGRYWLIPADGYGSDETWQEVKVNALGLGEPGVPTQRYYHMPAGWLCEQNRLVIFEEQAFQPRELRLECRAVKR